MKSFLCCCMDWGRRGRRQTREDNTGVVQVEVMLALTREMAEKRGI